MGTSKNAILTGSIPKQLLLFFLPIWFGTLFQQLYNTVDTWVVGRFVGTQALAAVGCTGAFVQLLVGVFTGLCSGAGILLSQSYGAADPDAVDRQVHTGLVLAAISGLVLTALGLAVSRPALTLMRTPGDILDTAVGYLNIYFLGMVPQMLYNMGTSALRAVGDSKRPLYFLIIASFANIALDLLFVAVFRMGVAGAAWATILSQVLSAALTLRCMAGPDGLPWHLAAGKLRMDGGVLRGICRIGLPAAVQGSLYSVSNIIIQSSINGFDTVSVAAWSVYGKIDFLFWMTMFSMSTAITTFAGQNFGARQYGRVRRGTWVCLGLTGAMTAGIIAVLYPAAGALVGFFSTDAEVIRLGVETMHFLVPCYSTYFVLEILSGVLRGCGDVKVPTLFTVFGVCVLRVVWLLAVVPLHPSLRMVQASYPITWLLTSVLFLAYYLHGGWLKRRIAAQRPAP